MYCTYVRLESSCQFMCVFSAKPTASESHYWRIGAWMPSHCTRRYHAHGPAPTTSRDRHITVFMSVFCRPKSKSSVFTDCSDLDSEIILSECRIVGALDGTRLELGVRLVTQQLYTYWYNTAVQNFKNYRCWSVERRQVP